MSFAEPWWLLLLLILPILWWLRRRQARQVRGLAYTNTRLLKVASGRSWRQRLGTMGRGLRYLVLASIALGLARPQGGPAKTISSSEGLDIVLAIDTSGSMAALDMEIEGQRTTRLAVIKRVVEDFIDAMTSHRIGIVIFGSKAYTQAPPTLDHQVLKDFLGQVEINMAGQATAIGDGLAVAIGRLQDSKAKSKVVILLTDGTNTAGRVEPLTAAEMAKTLGVRVHTIAVGQDGPVPVQNGRFISRAILEVDRELLRRVAELGLGSYFEASDREGLEAIYEEIGTLETSKLEVSRFVIKEEFYHLFVIAALLALGIEGVLSCSRLRRLPT